MRENNGGALTETTFFILLSLCSPNHGYGIMQFIEKETDGRVVLGPGTLYGAINTLIKKNWIEPYGDDNNRKKEYIITQLGNQMLNTEIKRLKRLYKSATRVIGGEDNIK